ncbi:small acid-soluble spore protein Tlp [Bacillus sp. FJAT-52991]|uniref:Small, acid-soluble spore protein Tlp n=1 Tax=Bacillus kandeliae TaxID=3129297 RepID=A0ABZ2NA27_9BACI
MRNQPKPDDRADNVEKLQDMIENTEGNIQKASETMMNVEGEEREAIEAKNQRRENSIAALREEMQDEANARQQGYLDQ